MKYLTIVFFLICLFGGGSLCHGQQPIIDIENIPAPLFRDPIFDGAADPTMIWNDETKEWYIFYTQRRANQELQGVAFCFGTAIGIAASADNGRSWRYVGTANLPPQNKGHNTFWAPHVTYDHGVYHLFVTYIPGVYHYWGGTCGIVHYRSKDLMKWKRVEDQFFQGTIDASVFKMEDGTWKMWYEKHSQTYIAHSKNLKDWTPEPDPEVTGRGHEAPVVFQWKGSYWMVTDPRSLSYTGLDVFQSNNGKDWDFNNTILNQPGQRMDDADQGRHADVVVVDDKAYIVYFTHPGREYDKNGVEIGEDSYEYRRSSLQMAELELVDGKLVSNRDNDL